MKQTIVLLWTVACYGFVRLRHSTAFFPSIYSRNGNRKESCLLRSLCGAGTVVIDPLPENGKESVNSRKTNFLIHWRGEDVEGYSRRFRHDEFRSALFTVAREETNNVHLILPNISFTDAMWLNASATPVDDDESFFNTNKQNPSLIKKQAYNQAMQYIYISTIVTESSKGLHEDIGPKQDDAIVYFPTLDHLAKAARRCSLVHALYQIVASSESVTYEALSEMALAGSAFADMKDTAQSLTWCVRVRHFRSSMAAASAVLPRYGRRTRSLRRESEALVALKPLLLAFTGPVRLEHPDCKIYIFDGLAKPSTSDSVESNKVKYHNVLTRRVAQGVRMSILNPNTRRCVTNTPLCPTAACLMCNIGQVQRNSAVLDPYAGSGSILLAAALLEPTCRTVGIEIAPDKVVDRAKIREDFQVRDNLTPPKALLHGDCNDPSIRQEALAAIDGGPFDCILTDPPYGIRESLLDKRPIDDLLDMIRDDRDAGKPLLRKYGRLVVYLPQSEDEPMTNILPAPEKVHDAGLVLELTCKQYLSDVLSRWLVSFVCLN